MLPRGKIAQDAVALAGDMNRNLVWHGGCGRPGSCRVGEDVQVGKRQFFDDAARIFKFSVGFCGETDHDVGADCGGRHGGANLFNLFAIVPGAISAVHAAEDGIAAGLQRHMRVLGDACALCHEGDELIGPIHRLN